MKQYYECHLTCMELVVDNTKKFKEACDEIGWTWSFIDGDPDLGSGIKCYATKQFNSKNTDDEIVQALLFARDALRRRDVNVIRAKVEVVVFDERYK